jgi:hypothetical protein
MDGVMLLGEVAGDGHEASGDDLEALVFEAADEPAEELSGDGIGFEDDEGALGQGGAPCHVRLLIAVCYGWHGAG